MMKNASLELTTVLEEFDPKKWTNFKSTNKNSTINVRQRENSLKYLETYEWIVIRIFWFYFSVLLFEKMTDFDIFSNTFLETILTPHMMNIFIYLRAGPSLLSCLISFLDCLKPSSCIWLMSLSIYTLREEKPLYKICCFTIIFINVIDRRCKLLNWWLDFPDRDLQLFT